MLKFLRTHTNSWIMKILLGLLVLSFGLFWGVAEFFRGADGNNVVASIQRVKITKQQLVRTVQSEIQRINTQLKNQNITFKQSVQLGFPGQILGRMVNEAVLGFFIKDLDLVVSDRAIASMVLEDPIFKGADGRFDKGRFLNILRANGLTEAAFLSSRRQNLIQMNLVSAIRTGDTVPAAIAYPIFTMMTQKRTMTVHRIDPKMIPVTLEEADYVSYYSTHQADFRMPEYREAEIILLDPAHVAKNISITQQQLLGAYRDQKDSLLEPESRTFSLAIFRSRDEALSAKKTANIKFAETHKNMTQDTLAPEIGRTVFGLKVGQVSEPLLWQGQHVVLKVNHVNPARVKSFETVKDDLLKELKRQKALEEIAAIAAKVEEGSNQGMSFSEIVKTYKLPVRHVIISALGRTKDNKDAGISTDVVNDIFSLTAGAETQLTELADGTSYMVRVVSISPAHVPEYKKVKSIVMAGALSQKKMDRALKYAETIFADESKKHTLGSAVTIQRFETISLQDLRDTKKIKTVPLAVLAKGFSLKKGEKALLPYQNFVYVVSPTQIQKVELSKNLGFYKSIKVELAQSLSKDIYEGFLSDLKEVYEVHLNNKALQTLA